MEGEAMSAHDRHHCKECGKALVEGRAYELGGYRWHVECFVCSVCSRTLNAETNMLVLGNGTLVCNNCSYYCNMCHTKIEKLAILTNDQAFCASCFICRNCKNPIDDLKYARTPHGIFCMSCHNVFMQRKLNRQSRRTSTQSHSSAHRHKQLPELPGMPRKLSSRNSSSSTVPRLGSPMPGTPGSTAALAKAPGGDSSSEYEVDPKDWESLEIRDGTGKSASASASTLSSPDPVSSADSSKYRSDDGSILKHTPSDTLKAASSRHGSPATIAQPVPEAPHAAYTALAAEFDSEPEPVVPAAVAAGVHDVPTAVQEPVQALKAEHEPVAVHEHITASASKGSLASVQSPRDSSLPQSPEMLVSDNNSFVSARQSVETQASFDFKRSSLRDSLQPDVRDSPRESGAALASPAPIVAASPAQLDLSMLSSPPRMNLSLDNSLPNSLDGSPTPRKAMLAAPPGAPASPQRSEISIPMRSPARSPTRPSSQISMGSSLSVQRSPEIDTQVLSVPKRSNRRGLSPGPAIARSSRHSGATSVPGPMPLSPRWNRTNDVHVPGITAVTQSGGSSVTTTAAGTVAANQHKRSFSENGKIGDLDHDGLLRSLVVAQHRIKALEAKLESKQQSEEIVVERKSSIASLEARQRIAREELIAIKNAAAQEARRDVELSEFGSKLGDMKRSLEDGIAVLVAEKERLKIEVSDLLKTREKIAAGGSSSPSKQLWSNRKTKRKEVGSAPTAPTGGTSSANSSANTSGLLGGSLLPFTSVAGSTGPSPYNRGSSSSGSYPTRAKTPVQASAGTQSSAGQFVTVLNQEQQNDRKNKLWPWKRAQRPRQVEIEEIPASQATAITYLNGTGGVSATTTGIASRSNSLLGESLEMRAEMDGTEVPFLVSRCIEEVEKRGLELEGIYRKSGSKSQIDSLMEYFETRNPELAATMGSDISAVTSALKQYLRYLKDPIINYTHYDDFVRAGKTQNVPQLRTLVLSLSAPHRATLQALIAHLNLVKQYPRNLMTTVNLATVFAPTLTRDITGDREMADMQFRNDATQMLIDHHDDIF